MIIKLNLKASTVLASISLIGSLSLAVSSALGQEAHAEVAVERPSGTPSPYGDEEAEFVEVLLRGESSPKEILEAIEKLGQLGKKGSINRDETIEALTEHLEFRRDYAIPDTSAAARVGLSPYIRTPLPTMTYPAVLSLFYIGQRSLPAVIKILEREEGDSLKAQNAFWVIFFFFDGDTERILRLLTDAAAAAETAEAQRGLSRVADKLLERLNKAQNQQEN